MKRALPIALGVSAALTVAWLLGTSRECRELLHALLFRRKCVVSGELVAGQRFRADFGPGFTLTLSPTEHGWSISVLERGTSADLSRLTTPFRFGNPCQLDGWHFRNLENTGPNDGRLNAPGRVREFCFWPGAKALHDPTAQDVQLALDFGRVTLEIIDHELTNLTPGEQAAFARISFRAELSWPRGYAP